jgi:hypothetical protein
VARREGSRSAHHIGAPHLTPFGSNSFVIEADWVPFGKPDSWGRPLANLKLGAQYVIYTLFNGGSRNYDGFGHDASGNNTLFLYAWLAF